MVIKNDIFFAITEFGLWKKHFYDVLINNSAEFNIETIMEEKVCCCFR